jgi:hypothetical protein
MLTKCYYLPNKKRPVQVGILTFYRVSVSSPSNSSPCSGAHASMASQGGNSRRIYNTSKFLTVSRHDMTHTHTQSAAKHAISFLCRAKHFRYILDPVQAWGDPLLKCRSIRIFHQSIIAIIYMYKWSGAWWSEMALVSLTMAPLFQPTTRAASYQRLAHISKLSK